MDSSSDSDLGLIDITAFTEMDSWDVRRHNDFDITDFPDFPEYPEGGMGTPAERVHDTSLTTELDDVTLDLIDVFEQGELDGWESSVEFLNEDFLDTVPSSAPAKEDRFVEQVLEQTLEDNAMDLIDVFELGELDTWAESDQEFPALGLGMKTEDEAVFEAFLTGFQASPNAAHSTFNYTTASRPSDHIEISPTSEVVVSPSGEVVVAPEGGMIVTPEGDVVMSPLREAVVVSPGGEVVVSPKVEERPLSPIIPHREEEVFVTPVRPKKPIPKRFRTKRPVEKTLEEVLKVPVIPEPEEFVEVDWDTFPALTGEGLLPKTFLVGGEELIDIGQETELDVWGEREDIFTFEPAEFEFLERAGTARTPPPISVPTLAEGLLIPDLEEEIVLVQSPQRAVQLFKERPISGLDPLIEVEQGMAERELLDFMFDIEATDDEGFKILLEHPEMNLQNWFSVAAQYFRKLLRGKLVDMEDQMNSIGDLVDTSASKVLEDTLDSVLNIAHVYMASELEKEIQTAGAMAQHEELIGNAVEARLMVIDIFNDMLSEFDVEFRIKLYDNFIRLIRHLYKLMTQDVEGTCDEINAVKTHEEQLRFLQEQQDPSEWHKSDLYRKQVVNFWTTNQRPTTRKALEERTSTLMTFLELRLDDVTYENLSFRSLWLAMRRAHSRVTELCYRATHKMNNRVNEYLGLELTPIQTLAWEDDISDSDLSYEDDSEDYNSEEEDYDFKLAEQREGTKTRRLAREEELEEMAVRFDYPPDIPLTERAEPDWASAEFQAMLTPVFNSTPMHEFLSSLQDLYTDLKEFHRRVIKIFPNINQLQDRILKLRGRFAAYINELIPKWIDAEVNEARRRKEQMVNPEVIKAADELGNQIIEECYEESAKEARRLLLSLCELMNEDLDMVEASEIYQNRVPSDKTLPSLLAEATQKVKYVISYIHNCKIWRDLESVHAKIVTAHKSVKTCLVMVIGKCDQTSMETFLGYEVHKLSTLGLGTRDVRTYHQIAKMEEESESARKAELKRAMEELERMVARQKTVKAEVEEENEAIKAAKESKNKLRFVVMTEVNKLRQSVRKLDEFLDVFMDVTTIERLPYVLQRPMEAWRSRAMDYINVEAKKAFKDAYARQIKKKDKILLKNEIALLKSVEERMSEIYNQHDEIIVTFLVDMMNKIREQLPTVDTDDYDLNEAMVKMNTAVAYIQQHPWIARQDFKDAWYAIEETHKRLKELVFFERETFGMTFLEIYLEVILVKGSEVARGINPSAFVVEENLGIEALRPLPFPPPEAEVLTLIPEQPPPKLTAKEKRELEKIALKKAEEEMRKEAAERAARKKQARLKKMDPATAALLQEKAEAKARRDAEAKEARRRAKEERDAKKAAVDLERRMKHAALVEEARKTRDQGKLGAKTRKEGEDRPKGRRRKLSSKARKVPIVDVNAIAQKLFDEKVKALSTISKRLTPEELRKLQDQAQRQAEASITAEQRLAIELQYRRENAEFTEKRELEARRAEQKVEKAKDLAEKIKRMKAQKEEEGRIKAEAAKEALKKKREAEEAKRAIEGAFGKKAGISEAALRRREAAKLVSKPVEGERKPRKISKPKPMEKKKTLEGEMTEEDIRKKREEVEKKLKKLKEVEAFKKEKQRKRMLETDMGYPGLSSFGKNRSRQAKPPPMDAGCGHDHHAAGGDAAFPGGPLAGKHDSMLVLLRATRSQFAFEGTEPHMYEPQPVIEREW